MLFRVAQCLLCGVRTIPRSGSNVITKYPVLGRSSRTLCDNGRSPLLEELVRSDAWTVHLRRLEEWGAVAEEAADCSADVRRELPVLRELRGKERELLELRQLLGEDNEDLKSLVLADITSCEEEIIGLKYKMAWLLLAKEEADHSDLILEVTAGVGGQEAMLFTAEIFDMYRRYATYKNWSFDILGYYYSDLGGVRHATASVGGYDAYRHLKYEGGVHRVQRVPKTEKQGRIHTSTMTVAILPQPSEIHLVINPKDLRIDTKRASGAGGQHVNTTDSAVRIVHLPTGR
ncbi:hypothetical protein GDO78_016670 [Eleutherodactylus coqui]|uniref:Prokaryotic-type class I peptide chain release factors domain-containing protein n=1 Tax=Eleutherodactylus coqui TaxID=57060 RepID=A0A8J6BEK4_ELECQ|nr:hypothetical protein GDO78_016670 [Eleutherodactylus coqui]